MEYVRRVVDDKSSAVVCQQGHQLLAQGSARRERVILLGIGKGLVEGRISKQLKEICLLDQPYVKAADGKQTVAKYVEEVAKNTGVDFSIKGFVRYETGEGLEKKSEDFAAEVAKQMM